MKTMKMPPKNDTYMRETGEVRKVKTKQSESKTW